ncbi:Murein hydrolase activator EnvC [Fusobacterium periodonticum]|nr:peptidoglycan DD-metalloendopeptidase family protein [Fusobacterium periodonticum]VTX91266.1 Murein hydrolase activator EnvC [Fusobacterium periodonticum]
MMNLKMTTFNKLFLFFLISANVNSATVKDMNKRIKNIDQEIEQKNTRIKAIDTETSQIEKMIKDTEVEIEKMVQERKEIEEEITVVKKNIDYGRKNLEISEDEHDRKESEFIAKIIAWDKYSKVHRRDLPEKVILMKNYREVLYGDLQRMGYIEKVTGNIKESQDKIEAEKIKLDKLENQLKENARRMDAKKEEQNKLKEKLQVEKKGHQSSIEKLKKEKQRISKEIERIIIENARKAAEKAAREKAARERAEREKAIREKAAREKAAREKAAREKVAREKAAREKAAREKAAQEAEAKKNSVKPSENKPKTPTKPVEVPIVVDTSDIELEEKREIEKLREEEKQELREIKAAATVDMQKISNPEAYKRTGKTMKPLNGPIVVYFRQKKAGVVESNGIEIRGKVGNPIVAAKAGTVIYASNFEGLGKVVMIDYGGGMIGVYGNLLAIKVGYNSRVSAGQTIGVLGLSSEKEPNLYYELRANLRAIDPLPTF